MTETVIKVQNLSLRGVGSLYEPEAKQYRIGAREGYKTFRETIVDAAKAPFLRLRDAGRVVLNFMRHAPSSMHAEGIPMRHALCPLLHALCMHRESSP